MVVITGRSGNLGSILASRLAEKGIESRPQHRVELTDQDAVENLFYHLKINAPPLNAVFHCAALTNIPVTEKDPQLTKKVNVDGTANVLKSLATAGFKPWVCYVSTSHVYKAKDQPEQLSEGDETIPRSVYAQSKLDGEKMATRICSEFGIPLLVARVFSYYSAEQKESFVVPRLAQTVAQAKSGDTLQTGWLGAYRDFLDAEDVADALIKAMEKKLVGTLNICSGEPTPIRKILDQFVEFRKSSDPSFHVSIKEGEPRTDDIRWMVGSTEKLKSALNFTPKSTLQEGLRKIWQRKN